VLSFRVFSRRNLAYPSRRSSLNPRPVNLLQPLVQLQKSQLLCNQGNPIYPPWRDSCLPRAPLAKGCKCTRTATLNTFRINTCKSVSKQKTLTPFRINTYEKQGGRGVLLQTVGLESATSLLATQATPVTCATWRLYPLCPQSIAHTSCRHGGVPSNLRKWP
jgi:hypothetical protein